MQVFPHMPLSMLYFWLIQVIIACSSISHSVNLSGSLGALISLLVDMSSFLLGERYLSKLSSLRQILSTKGLMAVPSSINCKSGFAERPNIFNPNLAAWLIINPK